MQLLAVSLSLVFGLAPAQAGDAPAPKAPAPAKTAAPPPVRAPQPTARGFRLARPTLLAFSVDTNAGPVTGTLAVKDVVARGLEGWGRFELTVTLDPTTLRTGDRLRDRVVAAQILRADRGPLVFTAYTRLSPPPRAPSGADAPAEPLPTLPAAQGMLEGPSGRRSLELRYGWQGDAEAGTLELEHQATLDELGLAPLAHPFVQLSGPVRLKVSAPLVRER